jgi:hypothetical protein
MGEKKRNPLLVSIDDKVIDGNNDSIPNSLCRLVCAAGSSHCHHIGSGLFSAQAGCTMGGGSSPRTSINPKTRMLEDQGLFGRTTRELSCFLFTSALLAGFSIVEWLFS